MNVLASEPDIFFIAGIFIAIIHTENTSG